MGILATLFLLPYLAFYVLRPLLFLPAVKLSDAVRLTLLIKRFPVAVICASGAGLLAAAVIVGRHPLSHYQQVAVIFTVYLSLFTYVDATTVGYTRCTKGLTSLESVRAAIQANPLTRWVARGMRHPEDAIWLPSALVSTHALLLPTIALACPGTNRWITWSWFLLTIFRATDAYDWGIADHLFQHTNTFKPKQSAPRLVRFGMKILDMYLQFVGIFVLGRIPYLAPALHNNLHHQENNGLDDFETTYPLDRTSPVECAPLFVKCMAAYSFGVPYFASLARSRGHSGRERMLRRSAIKVVFGMVYAYGLIVALIALDPATGLLFLAARLIITGMRFGFSAYATHTFCDPDQAQNVFRNSIDWVTTELGAGGGEDVHILHHRYPGRHWSTLRSLRRAAGDEYVENDALVIHQRVRPHLIPLVIGKRLDVLARFMVAPAEIARIEDGGDFFPESDPATLERRARLLELRVRPRAAARALPQSTTVTWVERTVGAMLLRTVPQKILEPAIALEPAHAQLAPRAH